MTEYSPMPGIDEAAIWDIINRDWANMTFAQKRLWEIVRIMPERWRSTPHKYRPRDAWVVGVCGAHVIWYNETWLGDEFDSSDSGFCRSPYSRHGQIASEFVGAWSLAEIIQWLLHDIMGDQPPHSSGSAVNMSG